MTYSQVIYEWDGEAMVPLPRFARTCDAEFVIGEKYCLEVREERSWNSHAHQFAWLKDAWSSLPERYATEAWAQSPEHLRKFALIKTGFCDSQTFACGSKAEALRWAANLKPLDAYSVVVAQGSTVVRYTARSQSARAMGKADFQASKTAILEFIAGLLEVPAETLERSDAA